MNCDKLICYLNSDARAAYEELLALGVDKDLAFTLVEGIGGESVFSREEEDGETE